MSTKYVPPAMKPKVPEIVSKSSSITKFLPFLCAGAAVGVSILALKELKKFKAEIVLVKNQQQSVKTDPVLTKKLELLEDQLKRINLFLANKNSPRNGVMKNVLKTEIPKEVKIINDTETPQDVEYEEVEVTDEEEEDED
jgi:hypothetical protein